MAKTQKKATAEVDFKAIDEERWAKNAEAVDAAARVAKKVFGHSGPKVFFGTLAVYRAVEDEDLAATVIEAGQRLAVHASSASSEEDQLEVAEILLSDDGEEHLEAAADKATEVFGEGRTLDDVLGMHEEIYGADPFGFA